jgi:DNA primase
VGVRKDDIIRGVSFLDILDLLKIKAEMVSSGNFTHRCCCPSPDHKGGRERTSSLYIDSINNNFYCYGCSSSHNQIDFYILATGCDFMEALRSLDPLIDHSKTDKSGSIVVKPSTFSSLMDISVFFRELQEGHSNDEEWIMNLMKRTDQHIETIGQNDVGKCKALLAEIKKACNKRYDK